MKMLQLNSDKSCYYTINDKVKTENDHIFDLGDQLGCGGNAVVLEGYGYDGTEYAIKFLLTLSEKSRSRFQQEIKVLQMVNHPNLIKYIDSGVVKAKCHRKGNSVTERDIPFIIVEKAEKNLKEYLDERGLLSHAEYISQFDGLSDALARLHKYVVHRDIKLDNILVIGERWVLNDLGLCTFIEEEDHLDLTKVHEKIGPKYWMSPEAINRIYNGVDEIIPASDVFQLSAVFWYVGTLRFPLGVVEADDWKNADKELCEVVLKGLSHNCKKRQQNGQQLHEELHTVLESYMNDAVETEPEVAE